MRKIVEAEIMSEGKTALKLTLSNGQVIEGYSLGIEPAFDEKGEELDYDVLAFRSYDPEVFFHLKDEDIRKVEVLRELTQEEKVQFLKEAIEEHKQLEEEEEEEGEEEGLLHLRTEPWPGHVEKRMRGLRTKESVKFNRFFALIQAEAKKQNAMFFADAGDGNNFETPLLEGENMMGWLIPIEQVSTFEPLWRASAVDDSWTDFYRWAVWEKDGDLVKIRFEE